MEISAMKLLLVGNFNMSGTGYYAIISGIADRLTQMGHEVKVLGTNYDGREHNLPYSVIPTQYAWLPLQIQKLSVELGVDWTVIFADIPAVIAIYNAIYQRVESMPRIAAAFPVESDPVAEAWIEDLKKVPLLFTFTDFGMIELLKSGLRSTKLKVGVDSFWCPGDKKEARNSFGVNGKDVMVLTVADNQERKNLPAAIESVHCLKNEYPGRKVLHFIVTSLISKNGWDLWRVPSRLGIEQTGVVLIDAGLEQEMLRELYRAADVFLLTSSAEGIGMPLYEAQACGCPVVVTRCGGAAESVKIGRTIVPNRRTISPWGTSYRYWVDSADVAKSLRNVIESDSKNPVQWPDWSDAAKVLIETLVSVSPVEEVKSKQSGEKFFIPDERMLDDI